MASGWSPLAVTAAPDAGRNRPARLHPFTPFALVLAVVGLAFLLPGPLGPVALYLATVVVASVTGLTASVRRAVIICLPLWMLLLILHGVLGDAPKLDLGGMALSVDGLRIAVAQAGRFGAIITASLMLYARFDPSRFLDAMAARGWSFHSAYLLVATLQAAPRLARRAREIVEAQRCRGLRLAGGPLRRFAALVPLVLPLTLGALGEVDDRAIALDTRGVAAASRRTPLAPPPLRALDGALMLAAAGLLALGIGWRALA